MIESLDEHTPQIAPSAYVASTASVIGQVTIAENASVWYGAVLRGDEDHIRIGQRSNVQDNAVIHTDPEIPVVIGEGVTIAHSVVLHGCIIGNNTLIGMGAIILNGAEIGEDCIVGAGALVPPGKSYPPGSLILGSPARRVRDLSDEERVSIRINAAHYIGTKQRYARRDQSATVSDSAKTD